MKQLINIAYDFWDKWCRYRYVDPIFSFAKLCLVTGSGLAAGGFGWAITAIIPKLNIPITVEFGPQQPIGLGAILILFGLCLGVWRIQTGSSRVSCFLIDHRGMPGMELGDPESDLPGRYKTGQIRRIFIDYSEDNNSVIRKIDSLNERLKQDLQDENNIKADLIYAGLAPIPFMFYSGHVISNRKKCSVIMEWDRHSGRWHEPSKPQKKMSIVVEKPEREVREDLAIAMPLSVDFSKEPIEKVLNENTPIMWIKLSCGAGQDSLSSKVDQQKLGRDFYNILASLRKTHPKLKRVQLFIAAQASFVFYLGQQYSRTVHPPINIYNFYSSHNKYDWSLSIDESVRIEKAHNLI